SCWRRRAGKHSSTSNSDGGEGARMPATLLRPEKEMQSEPTPRPSVCATRRRRGRAAILWGLALFVLTQVGLRLFIERVRPALRDPTFEIKYQQLVRQVAAFPEAPLKVVFLGSSMTAHGIDAAALDGPLSAAAQHPTLAFNFGIHRSGPLSQLVYVR